MCVYTCYMYTVLYQVSSLFVGIVRCVFTLVDSFRFIFSMCLETSLAVMNTINVYSSKWKMHEGMIYIRHLNLSFING